jgi:fucose permease
MNCASLGAAAIPLLIGILAKNISLESIPACLIVFFLILFRMFLLSIH